MKIGYWPLFKFYPSKPKGKRFSFYSKEPSASLSNFMHYQARFSRVVKENANLGTGLLKKAQEVDSRWERPELYSDIQLIIISKFNR